MCVAIAGTVKKIEGDHALVDFNGNSVKVLAGLVPVQPGDSVLVHAGCILQKVSKEEAIAMQELFDELSEL